MSDTTPSTPPAASPPPASSGISKEQAKKILKADLANMVKKVAGGRTLSSTERAILTNMSEGDGAEPTEAMPTYAKKQSELATLLGFKDRKTIQRWLKQPGNPGKRDDGRYDVVSWKAYAKANGHKVPGEEDTESHSQTRAKAEQVLLQNERLRLRLKKDREEIIPKDVAKEVFGRLLVSAKTRCYSSVIRMVTLSRLAPNTTVGAEEVKKEIDAIWQSLTDSTWLK